MAGFVSVACQLFRFYFHPETGIQLLLGTKDHLAQCIVTIHGGNAVVKTFFQLGICIDGQLPLMGDGCRGQGFFKIEIG